jgi:hypothetical protein
MVLSILPFSSAQAADPKIRFLNPSGYSPTLVVSDKPDKDASVHLVAWVQDVPANPLVEFEIQPPVGTAITVDASRVGPDTWEAFASVSSLTDGTYTLRATLYANFTGPGTGTEADSTSQEVQLTRNDPVPPPAAETVEMSYPPNGAPLGFSNITGKRSAALIDVIVSEGTDQVRALYSVSPPGTAPTWVACGFKRIETGLSATVRCTLEATAGIQQVSAVAVVANNTPPPSEPTPVADGTGDAHRVSPYVQSPTSVSITPETVRVEPGSCLLLSARAGDQFLRPIAAANLDIHAVGPDDHVRFGTIQRTTSPTAERLTTAYQAPDKGHVSFRDGIDCGRESEPVGKQGDHNIPGPGADDPQHIESTTGTDDEGKFYFALHSDSQGGTNVTAYVDVDDDDVLDASEGTGGARIGWGQDAPSPTTELFFDPKTSAGTSGDCQKVTLAVKRGGNALAGVNVDVHASGPDSTVTFCTPTEASVTRDPDQNHTGNMDNETTKHAEGETNSAGQLIFGVASGSSGTTELLAWIDDLDDDVQTSGEQSASGSVQWDISGRRSLSIATSKGSVRKGRSVQISGTIDGASACEASQVVRLKARRTSGGSFRTVSSTLTDASGKYVFRVVVKVSKKYKTVAPAADVCEKAISRTITIRAT